MIDDAELDRLGAERNRLFTLLNTARDERRHQREICSQLNKDLDAAYKAQQSLVQSEQDAWDEHQVFMDQCSERIRFFRSESDRHHALMIEAFTQSNRCWSYGDRTGSKSWSEIGKVHQTEMREAKKQASDWVVQARNAQLQTSHTVTDQMSEAKRRIRQLKDDLTAATERLNAAKADVDRLDPQFEQVRIQFHTRFETLRRLEPLDREWRRDLVHTGNANT
ncbi:MAG: putative nuclear RNA export factor SDE5 [Propionibacteriaceae bacterium]|nr:putative nuclear RNA export factor SDE5 [Propionibacteriaceae bacterium]